MAFQLHFVQGPLIGKRHALREGESLVIGRGSGATLRIPDPQISRRHCEISEGEASLAIRDMNSSNGTFVNGRRVTEVELQIGDRVILGTNLIEICSSDMQVQRCSRCEAELSLSDLAQDGKDGLCLTCRKAAQLSFVIPGYTIERMLGKGAFGAVYLGKRQEDDLSVALKIVKHDTIRNEADVKRFFREAESARKLVHPSIVQVYDSGEAEGYYFIAMEWVDGKSIAQHIQARGALTVRDTLRLGVQLTDALQHAYTRSIVHRDIKPDNILVHRDGIPKIVDFGLAKSFDQSGISGLTAPGAGMGTLAYMPPEQLDNALNADQRSDIYSLGATFYHMLAGRRPFEERTTRNFILKILRESPTPLRELNPKVPASLSHLVARAMAKKPEDRYRVPAEMQADLIKIFERSEF